MKEPTRRLTRPAGAALNPEVQPLVENLEILNGARGNGMDRAVLLRDLVDLGYVNVTKGAGGKLKPSVPPGGGTPTTPGDPTVEMPTAPTGAYASGGFTNILVAWDSPTYSGHAYAAIYRAQSDNFSVAVQIATTPANLLSDTVGTGTTWYYWIRFVNKNGQKGPIQSTPGIKGETSADIGDILDQLKGQIDESFLTPDFNARVNEIELTTKKNEDGIYELDGKVLDLNEQTTTLKAESDILAEAAMNAAEGVDAEGNERRKVTAEIKLVQKTLVTETGALAQQILTLTASVGDNKAEIEESKTAIIKLDQDTGQALEAITQRLDKQESDIDGNKASITTNSETIVKVGNKADKNEGEISSLAQQITTVESELGDTKSAVTTNSQTIAKINADGSEAYEAQWGVKASIGEIQAGIGLTAKQNPDGTTVSQCTVIADQFSVGHIKPNGQGETIYPFIVTSKGVYIDTAYIKAATVQELVAGDVIADTIKASASITAPKIKGGTIEIGSRFKVDENGNATLNNMTGNNVNLSGIIHASSGSFRGTVYATDGEFRGTVYATTGDFKGTVYAEHIEGDVVSSKIYSASSFKAIQSGSSWGAWGHFDYVRVSKPSRNIRTLVITVRHKVTNNNDSYATLGQVRITGTFGVQDGHDLSSKGVEKEQTFTATVPAYTTGTMAIQTRAKGYSSGSTVVVGYSEVSGVSGNQYQAQLVTAGTHLS